MSISRIFIIRPIGTSLLMLALFLSGLVAYQLLPVSALPNVDYPTIQIATFYPGASAEITASSITAPLESQLGQMPGLNQMTSTSSSGASIIMLQFSLDIDLDIAEQEVQASINAATSLLPTDLPNPPVYSKVNPADTPIITISLTSDVLPLPQIEDLADTRLAQKIAQLSGVGYVSISGGQRPAVRIQANPTALASKGLTLEDIRTCIATANVNSPKGSFDGPYLSYTIDANDQLLTSHDYKQLIISYNDGAPVRLQDVANVIDDAENVKQAAWMNQRPAIILNIQRQPGSNVIQVADSIKELIPQLTATLPSNIDVEILSDRTTSIRASIVDAQYEMLLSIVLVVLVIFVFLRNFAVTVIPAVAVPLSLIGSLGIMYFLGFSLNNFTLMALTIATGFVVDDAIVMIENINRYLEEGLPPLQAAIKGSSQIGFTIISLTVSLIAVLIPLLFMQDVIGMLFREFAITLSTTILLSAFVSLTLTPMMCALILKNTSNEASNSLSRLSLEIQNKIIAFYKHTLHIVLEHKALTMLTLFITVMMAFLLLFKIPKGFFPIQDTGLIQGISVAAPSISFKGMSACQQEIAKIVLSEPAVDNLSSFIGVDTNNASLNTGNMLISLKPKEQRKDSSNQVIARIQQKIKAIPGVKFYMQPVQDLTVDDRISFSQYQYTINAASADDVAEWTQALIAKLQHSKIITDVSSDLRTQALQTSISIDRDTASRLGISAQMINDILYDSFGQRQISTMFTQINQYYVILEVDPLLQQDLNDLNNLYLKSSSGNVVPFNAITSVKDSLGPQVISRQNQFPVATLSFNLQPEASLGEAIDEINNVKRELMIPEKVQTSFQGSASVFEASLANEGWLVLAAIVVVYIILGVLYESYIHPITILSTLPSATIGALLALILLNYQLTIIAIIGIILLIGIVMKNAIMMIDFALELERLEHKSPMDAIFNACLLRVRPILMTTMAALLGAVPLACASGTGAELRQPLGVAIIGGLIVSQILTLYTTPVAYLLFANLLAKLPKINLHAAEA
jgi:multidrug efflux pump